MNKKILKVIHLPYQNPWLNLAAEDYFLSLYPKDPKSYYLFFYQNLSSLILGKTLQKEKEIFGNKAHPPVLRRLSGGGSVLHGKGNLNFAFAAHLEENPDLFSVPFSYKKILEPIIQEMQKEALLPCRFSLQGDSDICLYQNSCYKKISGNSQVRKKKWLLHHGTFVFKKELLRSLPYYLRFPDKVPTYRERREHKNFMVSVLPFKNAREIERIIMRALKKTFACQVKTLPNFFQQAEKQLLPFAIKCKVE